MISYLRYYSTKSYLSQERKYSTIGICQWNNNYRRQEDTLKESRYPIFWLYHLRVKCSPPRSHSILVLRPQI